MSIRIYTEKAFEDELSPKAFPVQVITGMVGSGIHAEKEFFVVFCLFHQIAYDIHRLHRGHFCDMITQHPHTVERHLVVKEVVASC